MVIIGGKLPDGRHRAPVSDPLGWTPFHLGDALIAWWDAEDSASFTLSGSNVTAWADRKGGYAPAQPSSASQPTYSATGFNGRPGVLFDGVDDYLELAPVPAAIPIGSAPSELWGLVRQDFPGTVVGNKFLLGYGDSNAQRALNRTVIASVGRARMTTGSGTGAVFATDASTDFTGIHLLRGTVNASEETISIDGLTPTSNSVVPATAGTDLRIGANPVNPINGFFQGIISVLIITLPLSVYQADQLNTFMKDRGTMS